MRFHDVMLTGIERRREETADHARAAGLLGGFRPPAEVLLQVADSDTGLVRAIDAQDLGRQKRKARQ